MKRTRELTISAMLTALGVVFLLFGTMVEALDIAALLFASMPIVFAMLELRRAWPLLLYGATSVLGVLLFFNLVVLEYILFGGIYPILKYYLEKLPRRLALVLKVVCFNLLAFGILALSRRFFGLELEFGKAFWIPILLLANLTFLIYDLLMTHLIIRYYRLVRPKIARFLK